ncbi:MAG TPA: ABC transporter permease, partial [Thermoplasmata archaeon]
MSGPPQAAVEPLDRTVSIPSSLDQVVTLVSYQLRDYLRARRFLILFLLVAAIGVIVTLVVAHYRPPELIASASAFYGNLWGGGVPFVIVLAAIFFGGDAIAGEFQNKTGYFLMGLPVRRSAVYAGKFIAAFL